MKFKVKLFCIMSLISPYVHASGGSPLLFSLMMFSFFAFITWILFGVTKYYTRNIQNRIIRTIVRVIPISLILSPTISIEGNSFMILPSAVSLQSEGSRLNALFSILITSIFIYFYLRNKEKQIINWVGKTIMKKIN